MQLAALGTLQLRSKLLEDRRTDNKYKAPLAQLPSHEDIMQPGDAAPGKRPFMIPLLRADNSCKHLRFAVSMDRCHQLRAETHTVAAGCCTASAAHTTVYSGLSVLFGGLTSCPAPLFDWGPQQVFCNSVHCRPRCSSSSWQQSCRCHLCQGGARVRGGHQSGAQVQGGHSLHYCCGFLLWFLCLALLSWSPAGWSQLVVLHSC